MYMNNLPDLEDNTLDSFTDDTGLLAVRSGNEDYIEVPISHKKGLLNLS